jgi:UDP-N-acetylmuramoyl-L-alanyl-D-glutamate--2,6-diaminopimelate ligase
MQNNRDARDTAAFEGLKAAVRAGRRVSAHSGEVQPGDVFVAIHGPNLDGAAFIAEAVSKGATTVVTDTDFEAPTNLAIKIEIISQIGRAHV